MSSEAYALNVRVSKARSGGPMLLVNGVPKTPLMLFVNTQATDPSLSKPTNFDTPMHEVAYAAKHGVDLVSINLPVYLQSPADNGDCSESDALIRRVLSANPKALLLLRLETHTTPDWWASAHPDDIMLYNDGKGTNGSVHSRTWRRDVVMRIKELVEHYEDKFGEHVIGYHPAGQETGEWFYARMWENVLAGFEGTAKAAFKDYIKNKYKDIGLLRRAWNDLTVTFEAVDVPSFNDRSTSRNGFFHDMIKDRRTIDFYEFQNMEMADTVVEMCKAVKSSAPHKLAVVFYGYHFTVVGKYGLQASGHLGLEHLLESPYVDAVCSPVDYYDRKSGGGGYFMAPIDSVMLHGKLWIMEDDVRTHLAGPRGADFRLNDERETNGVLTRDFGHILTRGAGLWWMDLWSEGWFAGEDIWTHLGSLADAYAELMTKPQPYAPQIAVIVDEKSIFYTSPTNTWQSALLYDFRGQWYRIGAPVGMYLLSDLVSGKVPDARMYIFIDTFCLDQSQIAAIRKHVCCKGKTALWMYAPGVVRDNAIDLGNVERLTSICLRKVDSAKDVVIVDSDGNSFATGHPGLDPQYAVADKSAKAIFKYSATGDVAVAVKKLDDWTSVYSGVLKLPSSLLRNLAREAGAHIYVDSDDVVSAGNGFVSIHASSDGVKTFLAPKHYGVCDVLTGVKYPKDKSLSLDMKKGDAKLFRLINE